MRGIIGISWLFIFRFLFTFLFTASLIGSVQFNKKIRKDWLQGQAFFYQKRYLKAMDIFEELTENHPDQREFQYYYSNSLANYLEFKTWLNRTKKLIELKRFNHALSSLVKAETIYPFDDEIESLKKEIKNQKNSHQPLKNLNQGQLNLFNKTTKVAKNKLSQGDNESALKLFAQSLSIAPEATQALEGYNEAQKRYLAGQNQFKISALLQKAASLEKSKKIIEALAKYQAVLRFDPANLKSIQKIPELKEKIKQEKALSQKKELAKQYKNTGKRFAKKGTFQKAIEQYELGKGLLPDYAKWDDLVKEAHELQRIADEKEKQKLNQEVERNYNRGLAFVASEKYRDAITAFQQVVTDAERLRRTIMAEQAKDLLNKITKALVRQEEERVNPESPYYNLVQSLKALGLKSLENQNYEEAQKTFNQIIDLFPYNRFANQYLAVCKIKINPRTKEKIMKDFVQEVKTSIKLKQTSKARRILDVILFIDKDYEGVGELEKSLGSPTNILSSNVSPKKLNQLWSQAISAQRQNKVQAAVRLAREILRLNPAHANARNLLSRLETGKIVRTAPANIPPAAKRAYTQGILFYNTGALQSALGSFRTAIRIYPRYRKASVALQKCRKYLASQ